MDPIYQVYISIDDATDTELHIRILTESKAILTVITAAEERDINMDKVCVNFCGYDELLLIPSVGQITADRIWELRKQGDITPEMLVTIPHIRMDVVHQFIDYTTLCDFKFVDHVEDDLEDFADKCSIFSGEEQNEYGEEEETKCPNLQTIIEKSESLIPPKAFSFQYPQMQLGQESQEKKIKFDLVQEPVKTGKVLDSVPKFEQVAPRSYSSPVDRHEIKPTLSFRPKAVSTGIAQRKRKVGQSVMRPVAPPQFTPQLQTMLPGSVSAGSNVFSAPNMPGMPSTVWSTQRQAPTGTYCYNAQPIITAAPTMTTFQQPSGYGIGSQYPSQTFAPSTAANISRSMTNKASTTPLKSLKYDGTDKGDDWVSFLGKFEMYADVAGLSEQDKRAHLCWAVTGNAARFCLGRVRRNKDISYAELVKCMEKRFNLRKLTETVRIQFQSARQSPGEDLDDWAERLLSLADKAFGELPEEFVTSEVITKLCHGTVDKHAGSVAASFRPKTVDEALERIKWQQYNDKALFGQDVRTRNTREIQEPNSENFEENAFQVNNVKMDSQQQLVQSIDKLTENVDRNLKHIQSNIGDVQSSVDKNIQAVQAEMKGMERKWENEMEYMKDTINQIKKTGTSSQGRVGLKGVGPSHTVENRQNEKINLDKTTFNDVDTEKTFNDVKSVNTFNDVQSDKTFNDVHTDKTTFNDVDTDTTVCGKPEVCEEESVGNKVDNVFDIKSVEKKGQKTTVEIPLTTVHPPTGIDVGNQVDISETSTVTDGSERIFTTMQLGNSSLLRLSLELGDTPLVAAVDTAAEVTIISDKVFESLKKKPPMLRETVMHAAGRGMKMKTLVVGPVKLRIGTKLYETDVYVAPIDDDMLLGLNFMVAYSVTVDLEKLTFNIGGEMLEMSPGPRRSIPVVSKVVIGKRTVVPPHSVVHVQAKLENQLERYIIEPCDEHLPILIPRCLYNNQDKPSICLVNASDRYYTLKKNSVIAKAEVVNEIEPSVSTNQITKLVKEGR
ncbi:Hypothetical predicted protein [Mytilus galloprovincialis]|uniref:Peptidase A2 domain-containing protein n=1 Tax=Mytilus galloprovincialis TaxID=29158 RepID=A0A8B6EHF5_MYTGA|nr:Hypothetical predicted protein [Mytilus galloprovincialis]